MRALAEAAAPTSAWRDLRVRLLSAAVLAPLGLACLVDGGWLFAGLVLLAMALLGWEWAGLARVPPRSVACAMLLLWPGLALLVGLGAGWLAGLRVLACGLVLGPLRGGGILLIGLGGFALVWLRGTGGRGIAALLFVVLVVWASDSAAYLVGRALGGARLAPRISPGKTWSGAAGGLLGAMLAGALVAGLASGATAVARGVLFGGLLGIAAQAGDLGESALKRQCGFKDSGRLIPGHGGLLDRLDGLLVAGPLAALLSLGAGPLAPFWQLDAAQPRPFADMHPRPSADTRHLGSGWLEHLLGDKQP